MTENQHVDQPPTELTDKIINIIVGAVNLHHIDRKTIGPNTPLAQEGLALDSVDILEVVVAIEHAFGVKVQDAETAKMNFRTIGSIANFVSKAGKA